MARRLLRTVPAGVALSFGGALALLSLGALPIEAPRSPHGQDALETPYGVLEDYEFVSCWGCHETITEEWARSLHALAWERPRYQAAIEKRRRPESCHGCHIPERMQSADLSRKPKPRSEELEALHYGISCKSCHLAEDGAMLGPIEDPVATEAHRSRASRDFSKRGSNALCIACHKETVGPVIGVALDFELAGGQGESCVECHMDPVKRSMGIDDEDAPTPKRRGRSHRINGPLDPKFLAGAFDIEVEQRSGSSDKDAGAPHVRVTVHNAAGHGVPGLVDRTLEFEAQLLDADGAPVSTTSWVIDTANPLPLDGQRRAELAGTGERVRVVGIHSCDALDTPETFLNLELEL